MSCEKLASGRIVPCIEIATGIANEDFFCFALHEIGHILFHLDKLFYKRYGSIVYSAEPSFAAQAEKVQEIEAWKFADVVAKHWQNIVLLPYHYENNVGTFIEKEMKFYRTEITHPRMD